MKRSQTPHEQATDEVLMTRIAKRDKQAFDVLYNRYHKRLYGYLYRMCWQNQVIAEDLLQETFIRVFKAAKDFDPSRKFVTWLFSIGSNLVKNEYRRQSVRGEALTLDENQAWEDPNPTQAHDQGQWQVALQKALALLPESHTGVFWLRHEQQMDIKAIADILQIPEGTVKSRLFHTHRHLAKHLVSYKHILHAS
ncbi:MAG TPA: hypothetical protein DCE41_25790 [Cytophagales bacterium]|nr:hypothetical protein [Cytophagales bacterium]